MQIFAPARGPARPGSSVHDSMIAGPAVAQGPFGFAVLARQRMTGDEVEFRCEVPSASEGRYRGRRFSFPGAHRQAALEMRDWSCHTFIMRQIFDNIEAGLLTEELRRRGIPPRQRLRVVVECIEDDDADGLPMAEMNAAGGAFDWLADEPDIYSDANLVERYRE